MELELCTAIALRFEGGRLGGQSGRDNFQYSSNRKNIFGGFAVLKPSEKFHRIDVCSFYFVSVICAGINLQSL